MYFVVMSCLIMLSHHSHLYLLSHFHLYNCLDYTLLLNILGPSYLSLLHPSPLLSPHFTISLHYNILRIYNIRFHFNMSHLPLFIVSLVYMHYFHSHIHNNMSLNFMYINSLLHLILLLYPFLSIHLVLHSLSSSVPHYHLLFIIMS